MLVLPTYLPRTYARPTYLGHMLVLRHIPSVSVLTFRGFGFWMCIMSVWSVWSVWSGWSVWSVWC